MPSFLRSPIPDVRRRGTAGRIGKILREFLITYGLAITGLMPDLVADPVDVTSENSANTSAKWMRVR